MSKSVAIGDPSGDLIIEGPGELLSFSDTSVSVKPVC
jgi:hypothetical protein